MLKVFNYGWRLIKMNKAIKAIMEKNNIKVAIMLNANNHPYKIECIDANGNKLFAISEEQTGTSEQIVNDVIKSL